MANILSTLFNHAVESKKLLLTASRVNAISHLMYAYDIILCVHANKKTCVNLKQILNTYAEIIGQKVSNEKSRIKIPKHCS